MNTSNKKHDKKKSNIEHRPPKSWTKIIIKLPEEEAVNASLLLSEYCPGGFQFEDLPGGHSTIISGYIPDDNNAGPALRGVETFIAKLEKLLPDSQSVTLSTESVIEQDWGEKWKEHFKTVRVSEHIVVKPSWEKYKPKKNEILIDMDPGMAFGTGLHATTRMALRLIERLFSEKQSPPEKIIDVGTGTGILAIACALFGAPQVLAMDNDPDAVAAAQKNVAANKVSEKTGVTGTDLFEIHDSYDLVIANIIHDTLLELADNLTGKIAGGGRIILSGILTGEQEQSILAAYRKRGLHPLTTIHEEEWAALLLEKRQPKS